MAILKLYKNLIVFSIILIFSFMTVYYFKSLYKFDNSWADKSGTDMTDVDVSNVNTSYAGDIIAFFAGLFANISFDGFWKIINSLIYLTYLIVGLGIVLCVGFLFKEDMKNKEKPAKVAIGFVLIISIWPISWIISWMWGMNKPFLFIPELTP